MFQVMMNVLSTRGVLEQGACLDALISVLLDSSANQVVSIQFLFFSNNFCVYKRNRKQVVKF
jgi:hypothetical protein